VFIDGYYAGTVDDFDGFFQRLHLEPGEHEVQLYLAGHRTVRQKVYLQPTGTFRVRHTMEPLTAGETPDPRPNPPAGPPLQRGRYDALGRRDPSEQPERSAEMSQNSQFGALAIRVQPGEAEVIVDGERWDGPDNSDRLVIQLAEGEHRIEVRREGFSSYSSTVQVRRGETTTLNVSLVRE
jgi:PEGA domain